MMGEIKFANFTVPVLDAPAIFCVDASAAPVTVTFDHRHNAAYTAWIKKVDASDNAVTLVAPANHTFEGAATIELKKQYDSVHVLHAYTTFYILSVTTK